ncbi:hypothetical protein [Shewanella seohaensis]|uniref:Uncharacterized protein n=1 Tax=Shewanella seohaensis TaxID=755175 RepID=A0ABV4VXD3_9GAMM
MEDTEEWVIKISGERYFFTRMVNNAAVERYAPVSQAMAGIYAVAIVQGFQPPRCLHYRDKPAGAVVLGAAVGVSGNEQAC